MSNVFSKLAHWVHGAAVKVSAAFESLVGKDNAHKFAQGALAVLQSAEGEIVRDAVVAVSTLSLDAAGKRAAAFEKIASDFKSKGYQVADSLINLLIEVAVASLKGNFLPA